MSLVEVCGFVFVGVDGMPNTNGLGEVMRCGMPKEHEGWHGAPYFRTRSRDYARRWKALAKRLRVDHAWALDDMKEWYETQNKEYGMNEGAAVAFGLMGMAEAIHDNERRKRLGPHPCEQCGRSVMYLEAGACRYCRGELPRPPG